MSNLESYYLTDRQLRYAFDYNGASKGTGFCKNSVVNPSIAHAITVRRGGSAKGRSFKLRVDSTSHEYESFNIKEVALG